MSFLSLFSISPSRSFGGISGYVTIVENAVDTITITKQPVQQGAPITDHAYKEPSTLSIQMRFQDNKALSLREVYLDLRNLQTLFLPFNVFTPKRTYFNMLLASITQTTDKKTENCLAINCTFQEIIIVPISITVVPRSNQKKPGSTGGTQSTGKNSAIVQTTDFLGITK
jgi:hypothetical protein